MCIVYIYTYTHIYIYIYWSNNRWAQEPIHSDVVRYPICTRSHVLSQPSQHNELCSFQYTCLSPFGIINKYGHPQQGRTIIQHHFSGCLPRLPLLSWEVGALPTSCHAIWSQTIGNGLGEALGWFFVEPTPRRVEVS